MTLKGWLANRSSSRMRATRREFIVFASLLLLVVLLRLPGLEQPFENDSASHAYHGLLILRGETLYGTHHPAHHMPGVYYLYALAFSLLGPGVEAVKLLLMLWLGLSVYLVYRLGAAIDNRRSGLLAAIFGATLFIQPALSAHSSRLELFVPLPQLAAILTIIHLRRRDDRSWRWLFVGFFSAGAFLLKSSYLAPMGVAVVALLADLLRADGQQRWYVLFRRGLWITVGFALALFPVVAYFASEGVLGRFLAVFTIGMGYVDTFTHPTLTEPYHKLFYPLAVLAKSNALLLIAALSAALLYLLRRSWRSAEDDGFEGLSAAYGYIIVWLCFNFIETNVSSAFLTYYYVVFIPAVSLLAAAFFIQLYRDLRLMGRRRVAWVTLVTLTGASLVLSMVPNFGYYVHYARYATGRESYQTFLLEGLPDDAGAVAIEMAEIADYLRVHTASDATLYYWGNFVELYYLADRRSVIDMIWPIAISAGGPRERIFAADVIVLGNHTMIGQDHRPDWLLAGLAANYELETTIHGRRIYRRMSSDGAPGARGLS